jgi:hypothetical protein
MTRDTTPSGLSNEAVLRRFYGPPHGHHRRLLFAETWELPDAPGYVVWLDAGWRVLGAGIIQSQPLFWSGTSGRDWLELFAYTPVGPASIERYHWFLTERIDMLACGIEQYTRYIPDGGRFRTRLADTIPTYPFLRGT